MRNVLALVVALLLSAAAMAGGASPALAENAPNSNSANLSNDTRFWVDVRPI
jgi:hypothetical protein